MMVSSLKQWGKDGQSAPSAIERGIAYLRATDFSKMELGRYEIEDDRMFALLQEADTVPRSERAAESHRAYIDIQCLLEGEETIGWAMPSVEWEIREDRLDTSDYALYRNVRDDAAIRLKPGMFAVFYPTDLHAPCCCEGAPGKVRKVVVKIRVDLV